MDDDRLIDAADWIADQLEGQCIHDVEYFIDRCLDDKRLTPDEAANKLLLTMIDERVFCCDRCGWWSRTDELHNEGDDEHCDDCHDPGADHDSTDD